MIKFLVENKEWIFSGIGVFFLAGVVGIIKFVLNRKKEGEQFNGISEEQVPLQKVEDDNITSVPEISNVTVKKIIDDINSAPPFQRESVSKHYNGIKVRWEGKLWDIQKISASKKIKEDVRVIIYTIPENLHYSAIFIVNIAKYPDFKIAKRDSLIVAEGKIINCSGQGMYVEIEPSKLQILD